jgi:hypothetical protein
MPARRHKNVEIDEFGHSFVKLLALRSSQNMKNASKILSTVIFVREIVEHATYI